MTKMMTEIKEQPEIIKNILLNNEQLINKIVLDIMESNIKIVVFVARGTSDHAAIYGKYMIEHSLGIPVSLAAPSIVTMYHKNMDYSQTLVIGISQSGQALDVIEVLKQAKEQNAITIGITNTMNSPIAAMVKYHMFTNAGEEKSVAATKTFTGQLMMLAMLVSKWSNNEELFTLLKTVPNFLDKVILKANHMEKIVERYIYIKDCFVLSRGMNYPIALESALKIQETSYVKAKAYSFADFQHGPFAMISDHTPVIVFAPKGPSLEDSKHMLRKLEAEKAEIICISNDPILLKAHNISFAIPDIMDDRITPFFNIVFAQIFACKLSLARGCNPDAPRNLKKVTLTK
jgi:glucosamine--fructose-6-phosphate aminotransferase (isomerizing)